LKKSFTSFVTTQKEGKMISSKCYVSDSDWLVIQEVLPAEIYTGKGSLGGRPHADLRKVFCGILFWIRTGCQWELIPKSYGSKRGLAKYLKKWVAQGVFQKLMSSSLELYDQDMGIEWRFQSIDGSIKRAPGCTQNAGKNPTDRARPGTKHMILTDQKGIPLAALTIPANHSDMNQIENTFSEIMIQRPDPKKVKQHLCADKGFDSNENRKTVDEWGYKHHIRKKGENWNPIRKYNAKRWVVERTNAWLNQFRGIHTRRIVRSDVYEAMTFLACSCIILSKLA
jgi:putative transposase